MKNLNIREFPDDLYRDLKAGAALNDKSIGEYAIELIDLALSRPWRKPQETTKAK